MQINFGSREPAAEGSTSGCGRLFGLLFFGLFLTLGLLFTVFLLGSVISHLATFYWKPTPCHILTSEIVETDDDDNPYLLQVRYEYRVGDESHTSTSVDLSPCTDSDYATLDRLRRRYAPGSDPQCWVKPSQSAIAVLERRLPIAQLFFLILPLVFVAVGAFGLFAVFRTTSSPSSDAISDRARPQTAAQWVPIVLGAIFVAVGGSVFISLGLLPGLRLFDAQSWDVRRCTVISSNLRVQQSDDSTTYRIDVLFEYEVEGETYRSNRYDFVTWSSSGSSAKREVVDRFPRGLETECFVNPSDPSHAVLSREPCLTYLVGLLPLIFLIVGTAVLAWGLSMRRTRRRTPPEANVPTDSETLTLEARHGPVTKVIGSIVFATMWNGIVSVFLWQLVNDWRHGNPDWFLTVFLTPFVLVGLLSIAAVGYYLLALANPRVELLVTPSSPRLGDSMRIKWRLRGAVQRLDQLRITLEGREQATYTRGTKSHTDTEVFAEHVVIETSHHAHMELSSTEVHLPEDLMHTFEAAHNSIVWSLKVAGDIPRWPDVGAEFPLTVRPATARGPS